jgi:hypothetical protein
MEHTGYLTHQWEHLAAMFASLGEADGLVHDRYEALVGWRQRVAAGETDARQVAECGTVSLSLPEPI